MQKSFPPFRLDLPNQCLWRAQSRIPLAPKVFAVLNHLVENAGRLVTQEELLEQLWPDTYVQPEVLRKYILEIRRVLEDPPKSPRFIETSPKRGYRFIAEIHDEVAPEIQTETSRPFPEKLVGREAALAELDRCLAAAARTEKQVVFITGEAGIGKTTLVDAFQDHTSREGRFAVARGQCVEGFGGKEAYYPVLEALGLLLRGARAEMVETFSRYAPAWLVQFPSLLTAQQRAVLAQEILGATRERMVREFCEAIEVLTAERPLLLILEDLQWVDDSTVDLISALARRRAPARCLLLATYRPVDLILARGPLQLLKQDLRIHRLCRELSLERLTEEEVGEYLTLEFPESDLGKTLSGLVHRHSDGNPLFMVALLDRIRQQRLVARQHGRWVLTVAPAQVDPGVPETLQEMLEVQLGRLSAENQRLLRVASVAGQRFSAWAAATVADAGEVNVEDVCEQLADRQVFIKRSGIQELADGSASAQYEFKHTLYREILYRQLAPMQRRQFHLRLAERMEDLAHPAAPALASELAVHFEAGGDNERAIRYLMVSAGNAARRYAHRESIQLLHHALGLLAQLPGERARELEIEILDRISDVLYAQGEMEPSAEVDTRVAELAAQTGRKAAQVNALTRRARALAFLEPERAVAVCQRAVEVSRTHDDPLLQARAEMLMACWQIVTHGWNPRDAALCEAAREKIRGLSDELPAYYEILYAHVQFTRGDYAGAVETARAGIQKSIETDSLVVYLSAHSSLAQALLHLGRWGALLQVLDRALETAEKNGNAPWQGVFRATRAWLRVLACDYTGAREESEILLQTHTEEPANQVRTMAMLNSGFAALGMGKTEEARRYFQAVCDRALRPRFFLDWYWRNIARFGLSGAWLASGEIDKATSEAEALLQAALATPDPALQAFAWDINARVAMANRNWQRALECVQSSFQVAGAQQVPLVAWRMHVTAYDLHQELGKSQEALRHKASAAEILVALAHSFPEDEPQRDSLLADPVTRKIIAGTAAEDSARAGR